MQSAVSAATDLALCALLLLLASTALYTIAVNPLATQFVVHHSSMGFPSREILDLVELIFYVPALLTSLYVIRRHGAGRQLGWIYLALLGLLRIVGASTSIVTFHNPSPSLVICSAICFSIGLSPLLFALLGIIKRVNEGMTAQGINSPIFTWLGLVNLAALVLGIIAGTKEFSTTQTTRHDGYKYMKVTVILILVSYLALAVMAGFTFTRRRHILEGEIRLANAALLSLPFIGVRIVYSIVTAFDQGSTTFGITSTTLAAVAVQGTMSILMEFTVVIIYLLVGIFVRVIPRGMVREGYADPPNYTESSAPPRRKKGSGHSGARSNSRRTWPNSR